MMCRGINAFVLIGAALCVGPVSSADGLPKVLVVVMDGLRPDYVRPDLMPNLHAFGERGVVCENHHAVFPTVTRVNAASVATGTYPGAHGLMGNTIYVAEVEPGKALSAASAENLKRIDAATDGQLLSVPTLGEILSSAGMKLLVASAGSPGSAFLLNHRVGGAVLQTEMTLPESLAEQVMAALGPPPEASPTRHGGAANRRAVDAFVFGARALRPEAAIVWISDPDHTAHQYGIGSETTSESLRLVDAEFGRLLEAVRRVDPAAEPNVIVTSDHGFSTHVGPANLLTFLVERGLKKSIASNDVILAGPAIYVRNGDDSLPARIVAALQETEWAGAIFTRAATPGSDRGVVSGTLSFEVIYYDHPRAPDVLVDVQWTDAANDGGWRGTTTDTGVAGHGSSSPFDIHNTLIAAGPDFARETRSSVPTGNIDIAPTVCRLLGVKPARTMQGRVLEELLREGPDPGSIEVKKRVHTAESKIPGGRYVLELHKSQVGGTSYVDFTQTRRVREAGAGTS